MFSNNIVTVLLNQIALEDCGRRMTHHRSLGDLTSIPHVATDNSSAIRYSYSLEDINRVSQLTRGVCIRFIFCWQTRRHWCFFSAITNEVVATSNNGYQSQRFSTCYSTIVVVVGSTHQTSVVTK